MDDINAPDYAFGLILAWARGASAEAYSFHPQGGLDRARNVTVLVKSLANATQLLPSVLSVPCPHGPPCDVVVFDFVPQLLCLLQNPRSSEIYIISRMELVCGVHNRFAQHH